MGEKGARQTAAGASAVAALVDDLAAGGGFGELASRKMFGGFGVFGDGVMFAIVDSAGECFLRVGPDTQPAYEAVGAPAHGRMPYRRIPDAVRAEAAELHRWAAAAHAVARAAKR